MIINTYKKYLFFKLLKKKIIISFIFFVIAMIINLLEEIGFLRDSNDTLFTPILLTFLNAPSLLYEMLPFIFLISTQLFFIDLNESGEIFILRKFGIDNLEIIKFLIMTSLLISLIVIIIFYNFSSILKKQYLMIKNSYANDNKYLAVITKNGLWIKDSLDNQIIIINAKKIEVDHLIDSSITILNNDFNIVENLVAKKINIKDKNWELFDVLKTNNDNSSVKLERLNIQSNFNYERINNLYSDLSSLTFLGLLKIEKDYKSIGYSTDEIIIQKHSLYSFPFLLCAMTIISSLIMINIKNKTNLFKNIGIGVLISVLLYYFKNFSNLLGENDNLPLVLSVWLPSIFLLSISLIGIIKINEN